MAVTFADIKRGGGIAAFCLQYHRNKGSRDPWERVREWARREWPGIKPQTLEAAIALAKSGCSLASRMSRSKLDREFDASEERAKQTGK